ncbi:MAG: ATP-binding protein/SpoIIE family protein phosphatase [Bacteroidota bacterium]|nr:ATP-binding protein/SpoIIE family protein phosphatase [Bacteroidota bacterium]MDP4190559.1 ATP-binding protein/SpoIIE family protein phosphatase [Bacteroidota bacterium]MDP4194219.1 ATP-binding protein/SpoIIE family protein phosphatase [Bacteroidota bacterium]
MEIKTLLSVKIQDRSNISEARRLSASIASEMGFNETATGKIAVIVSEMATNIIKHCTDEKGELLVQKICLKDRCGIELIAIDKGPGMRNVTQCLTDGYSTAGSQGTGLGAIKRMSDKFDIYSSFGNGTIIISSIWLDDKGGYSPTALLDIGGISLPKKGERVNGDKWAFRKEEQSLSIILSDGLGHGVDASAASLEAIKCFNMHKSSSLSALMGSIHDSLRHTRGAAVALAEINYGNKILSFCGIGNINCVVQTSEKSKTMISHNGIAGHEIRKIQTFETQWIENSTLIMHSDGLSSRWNLEKNTVGLQNKAASITAAILYRDYSRGNDDLTVVVTRENIDMEKNK